MAEDNQTLPPQEQPEPGKEGLMNPRPEYRGEDYKAAGKLEGKVAIITGGDSGIGRSVAVLYAREGADVAILYLDQHQDAEETRTVVEQYGRRCLTFTGDVADREVCRKVIDETLAAFGKLDIVVNNAAEQHPQEKLEDISEEQWEKTFRTNIFGMFQMTKAALPHLGKGASIINTTSVTAYKGSPQLLDYSATKGAITAFTRSLSMNLADRGIRVNGVAPGPIWTPLIPSTFDADEVAEFGSNTPMKRPGQPDEVAPAYVYLASSDAAYVSGQVIHVNGGTVVNG
ncbi:MULTISPECIES: SDR family oxidoreductase [Stutzerimonas]|jgi:NAD(P)-dependent dehydrogenase (short-subunit alcohol dehydrogenase family)|uniref:SDR family oxidoreductase n=1 Tax=Stutzerimonas TaxID=2901164 RepID=UPI000627BA70|nr:SDR family oxidoreductase [Stutzerimonas kunmingensis]KKJ96708.1 short-chain dehydrogenase [Stutzerimonas stutzeri]MAK85536.1 NAD(P)-dependent oxidoreductase [Pseudomonas sp.]RRU91277.1 glucose 1-dehydrogenase [Stutzerimonas xanthomarina]TVT69481.1 MAG: SDR family oxidoreductase [Pseudomonas sp.]HCH76158.1 NAD(P)-dependent oxidoreductase [Pseudomonas sp.]|tara:strand:- start:530 stop:1387 length:858 start_codon:yes stop_codon:yes gene_type:complete